MGKKRRIMTSGQKFVDKHRALLKKMMDLTKFGGVAGDAAAIDIPGQPAFIDNLKVTDIENQTFSFIAALGGVPANSDTLTVTLNGTVLAHTPDLPNSIETETVTIDGVEYTKAYFGRPNLNAPTGTNWQNTDRRCCAADANTPAVANVGENTLKVAVTQNNKVRASKTVKFTVTAADGAMTDDVALVTDGGSQQLDINITSRISGKMAGDHDAWAMSKNGYEIEVTKDGVAVALSADGANRTLKANAADVANAVAVVPAGGAGQLTQESILAVADAGNYIVTFFPLNRKGQRNLSLTAAVQNVA